MSINIISFNFSDSDNYKKSLKIRKKVFVEEQQVDKNLEIDDYEKVSIYYLLLDKRQEIATVRYRKTDKGIKIERFAVLKNYRGKEFGKILLEQLLSDLSNQNSLIYLNAQETAVNFYSRNKFVVSGNSFVEADIIHYKMVYEKS